MLKYLSMRTKVSLAFTVALLNITSSIFNRKLHIEKHLYRGEFAEIYRKYNIFSLFLADRESFFLSTEIRKAGVMIQLPTFHYLNTYFRMFITLSINFYSLSTDRIQLRSASFEIICRFCVTKI